MHHRLNILIALTALLAALSMASCGVDNDTTDMFNTSQNMQSGKLYNGKWDIGGKSIDRVQMNELGSSFVFGTIPALHIAKTIFAGHTIDGISTSQQSLDYESVRQSDGTYIYAIEPTVWQFEAVVDGKCHNVKLTLGQSDSSTDRQSWGKYAPKSRVLTVFLHFTTYTIDNATPTPLQMKLTYTGTPITDC